MPKIQLHKSTKSVKKESRMLQTKKSVKKIEVKTKHKENKRKTKTEGVWRNKGNYRKELEKNKAEY